MSRTRLPDLAGAAIGGRVLWANDEFFAPKERLLDPSEPVRREGHYTDRGHWMDGWETRRRREPGHDRCLLRLGAPGIVRRVVVDTTHFEGNAPESCSIEGTAAGEEADRGALEGPETEWVEVVPRSPLRPDALNVLACRSPFRLTHVRLNIFPDGGVARLRVQGEPLPLPETLRGGPVDLADVRNGASIHDSSDAFFGSPERLLMPGRPENMGDGWETRRRRGPGHDWVVVRLAVPGTVGRAEVDTTHFKGNFPESCTLEIADDPSGEWRPLLGRTRLQADRAHVFHDGLTATRPGAYVRLSIFPDGGVARLRLHGVPEPAALVGLGVRWLDAALPGAAHEELLACCGSSRWAEEMAGRRPFGSLEVLLEEADRCWAGLEREDRLEALSAHPRIGERADAAQRWSEEEQAGARGAGEDVLSALVEANRAYEERFGHLFVVFATGKTASEMLELLQARMSNDPETELGVAAEEQRKIGALRLRKLVGAGPPEPARE